MSLSNTRAFVNPVVAGLVATIGFGGSVGLTTVWMRHQVSVVAAANADLERQISDTERRLRDTVALVEEGMNPDVLRRQNIQMQLGLVELSQAQIETATDDPVRRLVARANQRVFERESGPRIGFRLPTAAVTQPAATREETASVPLPATEPVAPAAAPDLSHLVKPTQIQLAFRQ